MKEEARSLGIPLLDFDGYAEFWVESIDDWKSMVEAPDGLLTLKRKIL